MMIRSLILLSAVLTLVACGRNLDNTTYTSGNTVGKVVRGTVLSAQPVTIKDNDDPQRNSLGGLAGGVVGGIGGSAAGGGTGRALATAGGAIAGAVIGSFIEDELSTQNGTEYIVELASVSPVRSSRSDNLDITERRGESIDDDVKDSIELDRTASNIISVIQTNEVIFQPGQSVLVVYNDDRPRLIADQTR